ncbi:MAG: single-stranded DNA-binding protein [Candidatus Aminicenantes bacterium]|nr:single-stranded DNA-binding protein [Candidatus Aminicenantes bacterium]
MSEVRLAAVNRVFLTGRLTRDVEVRYAPSGTPVAAFSLASNRRFRDRGGEWREETTYVDVIAMGRGAELYGPRLHKGTAVFVEGRLHTRVWQSERGRRQSLEVVVDRMQVLDRQVPEGESGTASGGEPERGPDEGPPVEGELPF